MGTSDQTKRTNEIATVVPMLDALELNLTATTVTTDALLTQHTLAHYLLKRRAHFVFTVKANHPTVLADLQCFFHHRLDPDFREPLQLQHGRLESRAIWTTSRLNHYLSFPHVEQAFLIERTVIHKTSGKRSVEHAYGITSHTPDSASPQRLLALNRGHWCVESAHHTLDTAFDEDRCRIRTGHGPENTSRLRRFAIGLIRAHSHCVAAALRKLQRNTRLVFDYLKLTRNSLPSRSHATLGGRAN